MKTNQLLQSDPATWPAVLSEEDAAKVSGMKVCWFEVWAKKNHVHCLGGYQPGCARYYATIYIQSLKWNLDWLDEAFKILREGNRDKNSDDDDNKKDTP